MRIGLVAMSGIRVCDEELLRLGLTLPGFVERSKVIASLPSLGLLTLAGMTPKEHEVAYVEVPDVAPLAEKGEVPNGFDLVAISSYSAQIDEAYRLGDMYRERGVRVVLGGPHVTAVPEEAKGHADAVVVGEGEVTWHRVLQDADNGGLQPFYGSVEKEFDLAEAPMPAFELLDMDRYNRLTVQTSRGCPRRCEFCASSVLIANRYKQKPMEKVLAEVDRIRKIWDHPFIEFADDNTFINFGYWKRLLPELEKRRIRWFAETDLSVSRDRELLHMMREAGCAQVLIGLESPLQESLDGMELTANWKHEEWPHYRDAIRTIQSHGISVNGCFIIGLDADGPEIFEQVEKFVREAELQEVQVTIQTAFPGTPLYDRLRSEGRLLEETNWRKCTLFDVNFTPKKMTAEELTQGFRRLAVRLYSDEFTRWRRNQFRKTLRALKTAQGGQDDAEG